jgi:MFS family permease
VYHLSASESGLALIPLAAVSTGGAAIAGKAMARMKHYKRVAIIGTAFSAAIAAVLAYATPMPLWALLALLSLFALGLGTTFPISVVSIQNAVARWQVGTVTGALNFFRALAASFTVAAFTAILLMALGTDVSVGEGRNAVNAIASADMVAAFRWVLGAAAAMMAAASLLMVMMEERPLAGPAAVPAEMAE